MPAHLREIVKKCQRCSSVATQALYNTQNAIIGYYCRKHSQSALDEALAREDFNKHEQ